MAPAPKPPAAPAPFISPMIPFSVLPISFWILIRPLSKYLIISELAPFCLAKTWAAPSFPANGFCTSVITLNFTPWIFCINGLGKMEWMRGKLSPIAFSSSLSLFKNLNPKAAAIPIPASFVADPPMVKMISMAPFSMASRMSSPVPKVLVKYGFLSLIFKSSMPEALDISM